MDFGDIFIGRTHWTDGQRESGSGKAGRTASINARRLHSATMTNLIAAFHRPPDNYDDSRRAYARITLSTFVLRLSSAIKND